MATSKVPFRARKMPIQDEQLSFNTHLRFNESLGLLTGDPTRDAHLYWEAEVAHALCVTDAIRDVYIDVVDLTLRDGDLRNPGNLNAVFYLRHGVARRTIAIWHSLRNLVDLIHPDRTEPLTSDSVHEAATALNVIYINIRGTLDNFAWCLRYLFDGETMTKLRPAQVDLFGKRFLENQELNDVATFLCEFRAWNQDLRRRRDPAAPYTLVGAACLTRQSPE
jgi:hypothetical protein